jgi:NADH dehydrogenase FAD-containing subunit
VKKPRLVLVGLGHAHIEVIRRLAVQDSIDAEVTLVSPSTSIVYSGLIPAFLAQQCTIKDASIEAGPWIEKSKINFIQGKVTSLVTNESLQSVSHPEVFGAGDCIHPHRGHYDKSGILPVRQGALLLSIFKAQRAGRSLPQFVAKKNLMYILNHGNRQATLLWYGRSWTGRFPSVL